MEILIKLRKEQPYDSVNLLFCNYSQVTKIHIQKDIYSAIVSVYWDLRTTDTLWKLPICPTMDNRVEVFIHNGKTLSHGVWRNNAIGCTMDEIGISKVKWNKPEGKDQT